jgi:Zn-dependent protease with chaperone function
MNFFEHQRAAKNRTRWLLVLFTIAVILIVALVDLLLLYVFGQSSDGPGEGSYFSQNGGVLIAGAVGTTSLILLASLFRFFTLTAGGGKVIQELGGAPVDSDTRDMKRLQLRNVVEEMAIAAGIPVPEIYVLEREPGINAFAAGLSTSDAAIAVTRGLLETMSREELQGVIAHEFSHVLNGDMRLNLRLMGVLFGILVLAIIGRRILHGASRTRGGKNSGGALIIGLAVMLIGYVGLFFARWIKAAVSRQREFLADASAVQFTRNPESIGGALKKIAVHGKGTFMQQDTEEIAHMLFGQGAPARRFATHPPILERIRRIQPGFREEELKDVRRHLDRPQIVETPGKAETGQVSGAGSLIDIIGNPDFERLVQAALLLASIPEAIMDAAHSVEWAPALLLYATLDSNREIRLKQQMLIARELGAETESQVHYLLSQHPLLDIHHRLPLFELVFPALKRRPLDELIRLNAVVGRLIMADDTIDTFEYLLAKMTQLHLREAEQPNAVKLYGNLTIADTTADVVDTVAILCHLGQANPQHAAQAFAKALEVAGLPPAAYQAPSEWMAALDRSLPALNLLRPADKQRLLRALVACVMFDGRVLVDELELLRVLSASLHVPLPPFHPRISTATAEMIQGVS